MSVLRVYSLILIALAAHHLLATPVTIYRQSGTLQYQCSQDTLWTPVADSLTLCDNALLRTTGEGVFTTADSLRVVLKDSCRLMIWNSDNTMMIDLKTGQLIFDRKFGSNAPTLSISARGCVITPIGTIAAVKITRDGAPTFAVIQGALHCATPAGAQIVVSEGMSSGYNPMTQSFTPVKQLTANSIESIEMSLYAAPSEVAPVAATPAPTPVPAPVVAPQTVRATTAAPAPTVANTPTEPPPPAPPAPETAEPSTTKPPPVAEEERVDNTGTTATTTPPPADGKKEKTEKAPKDKEAKNGKPSFDINAGTVTIDNEQWTRIAFGIDVPLWRFGICFDLELFLDPKGNFSNRSWDFDSRSDAIASLTRKIRYIRFNKQGDPLFIKVGGIDNVTHGYGFLVDRFSNMNRYPGIKLLGIQFETNKITPIGITLQAFTPDIQEYGYNGGIAAVRLALHPLKFTDKPVIKGISIGGSIATDLNQYAPSRQWDFTLTGQLFDRDKDNILDSTFVHDNLFTGDTAFYNKLVTNLKTSNQFDTIIEHRDEWTRRTYDPVTLLGADVGIPLIAAKIISLDLYGQAGLTVNEKSSKFYKGWGIGAPGVALKIGPAWGRIEYRHTQDKFTPGYFNAYYLDERLLRSPVRVKEASLPTNDFNGILGALGFSVADIIVIDGHYQMLVADTTINGKKPSDQRFDATAAVGEKIITKIPRIRKVEVFYDQQGIDQNFFRKSELTKWGYRVGVEVVAGAYIIWQTQYGWKMENGSLKDDKIISLSAGISF